MKKQILFIMLLLVSAAVLAKTPESVGTVLTNGIDTVYHDAKSAVSTIYSDGKEAVRALYPGIRDAISSIAKAIGVAAEHVYTVLVKQYVAEVFPALPVINIITAFLA